jgi:hypothetical protein
MSPIAGDACCAKGPIARPPIAAPTRQSPISDSLLGQPADRDPYSSGTGKVGRSGTLMILSYPANT